MLDARIPSEQYPRVDSQGQILTTDALKIRGMHAAQYHKTSIEAMLHSRHAGGTPYRTVLGDVSCHTLSHLRQAECPLLMACTSQPCMLHSARTPALKLFHILAYDGAAPDG